MKILIVDDESLARQRMRDLLSDIGEYEIVGEAVNGSEAIEKSVTLKPDLLLIDIRMPVMDGLEAPHAGDGWTGSRHALTGDGRPTQNHLYNGL
jgi:YesN/AraC family two-component response regulator